MMLRFLVVILLVFPSLAQADDGCYLVAFTSRNCSPCQRWKQTEMPRLEAAGHKVAVIDISTGDTYGVRVVPEFWVVDRETKRVVQRFSGFVRADSLLPLISVPGATVRTKTKIVTQDATLPRFVQYGGMTIDLETYSRNCNCGMCQWIRAKQREYQDSKSRTVERIKTRFEVPAQSSTAGPQAETPDEMVSVVLESLRLNSSSVFCDLGCGRAKTCIRAVQRYNCRAIGIEIDDELASQAREEVDAAGLSERITILTMDALEFDPETWGVTAVMAHQYPELLEQLKVKIEVVGNAAVPYHGVPGLDGVWVYRSGN